RLIFHKQIFSNSKEYFFAGNLFDKRQNQNRFGNFTLCLLFFSLHSSLSVSFCYSFPHLLQQSEWHWLLNFFPCCQHLLEISFHPDKSVKKVLQNNKQANKTTGSWLLLLLSLKYQYLSNPLSTFFEVDMFRNILLYNNLHLLMPQWQLLVQV